MGQRKFLTCRRFVHSTQLNLSLLRVFFTLEPWGDVEFILSARVGERDEQALVVAVGRQSGVRRKTSDMQLWLLALRLKALDGWASISRQGRMHSIAFDFRKLNVLGRRTELTDLREGRTDQKTYEPDTSHSQS